MGIFSALGLTANKDEKRARRGLRDATVEERGRRQGFDEQADEGRSRFLGLLDDFDPSEFMQTAAAGVGADLQEGLTTTLSMNNQSLNDRGFFGSSLNTGKISKDFNDRLSRAMAALSFQTANLEFDKINAFGGQGRFDAGRADRSRGNELDLTLGNLDAETDARDRRLGGTIGLLKGGAAVAGAV